MESKSLAGLVANQSGDAHSDLTSVNLNKSDNKENSSDRVKGNNEKTDSPGKIRIECIAEITHPRVHYEMNHSRSSPPIS